MAASVQQMLKKNREQPIVTFISIVWGLIKPFAREALDGQTEMELLDL